MQRLLRFKLFHPHNLMRIEIIISLIVTVMIFSGQAVAVTRFLNRSLLINNAEAGAVSSYTVSLNYNTLTSIGSMDLLFCEDPIPTDPCFAPSGLDISHVSLSNQTGETGFSISKLTSNDIVISRNPSVVGSENTTYTFSGVINPNNIGQPFSIRLSDYASSNASGPVIDLGSVISAVTPSVLIETQVPPMLIFCLAQQVNDSCSKVSGGTYADLGDLTPKTTLLATSQMAVGTNATAGYAITINGFPPKAGPTIIDALSAPTKSNLGVNQFGINLVANDSPVVGSNPDGASNNTVLSSDYAKPNKFLFRNGDVVASAPNVSLVRRYTVSYIINSSGDLRPGVYSTTITYICSGRF